MPAKRRNGAEIWSNIPTTVVVRPGTVIMESVEIGELTKIGRLVHIGAGTTIGSACKIQNGAQIFGARVGDNVLIGPSVLIVEDPWPRAFPNSAGILASSNGKFLTRPVRIERGASIGAGAIIAPGVIIGEFAMIGAGSVVLNDVPAFGLVLGNPGRLIGTVCYCGRRVGECAGCDTPLWQNAPDLAI